MPMSLNLKTRQVSGRSKKAWSAVGSEAARYLLVDKLFLFEWSPRCVGGLCVYEQISVNAWALTVRVLLWHFVGLIYKAYRYQ